MQLIVILLFLQAQSKVQKRNEVANSLALLPGFSSSSAYICSYPTTLVSIALVHRPILKINAASIRFSPIGR
jgi:hypothetical protein